MISEETVRYELDRFTGPWGNQQPIADLARIVTEQDWIGVLFGAEQIAADAVARLHRHLTNVFPGVAVEIRVGGFVYQGPEGNGLGRKAVAVLSGKGGVGKSTVSVNLALTLFAMGAHVGLVDADLAAPDIPHMLGMPPTQLRNPEIWRMSVTMPPPSQRMRPRVGLGFEVMSAGFAIPEGRAIYAAGPTVSALIRHLLFDVVWTADVLLIDTPPGIETAIQVLARDVPLSGAILVTTPQDLAQMDTERTLALLRDSRVPVIGVVQNMSSMICPHCETELDLFAQSPRLADQGAPVLARIPFDTRLAVTADRGQPLVLGDPTGPIAYAFGRLGLEVRRWLDSA